MTANTVDCIRVQLHGFNLHLVVDLEGGGCVVAKVLIMAKV